MKAITWLGIGLVVLTMALALPALLPAPPAQADFKVSQDNFESDCNTTTTADFGGGFSGDGVSGTVTVPAGKQLEVFNFDGDQNVITVDCTVNLLGEDTELNLAEGTNLLFFCNAACVAGGGAAGDRNFTINGPTAAGFEIEVQVKKNSTIEAQDFTVTIAGAEEAEVQFEENFCLVLHGDLNLSMSTGSDEGGDVQFKKFDTLSAPCAGSPNIGVAGNIVLSVAGEDSEIQIEESNHMVAGGNISVTGVGVKSQVQTKKNVTLGAGGDILASAPLVLQARSRSRKTTTSTRVATSRSKPAPTASWK